MAKPDETRLNSLAANGFRLTPEQEEILNQADRFAESELWPLQQKMDDEEWWPPQAMPALARMGFLGVTVAAEFGGADSDFFTSGLIAQGLARWNPAIALSYVAHQPRIDIGENFAFGDTLVDDLDQDGGITTVEQLDGGAAIIAGDADLRDEQPAEIDVGHENVQVLADQDVEPLLEVLALCDLDFEVRDDAHVEAGEHLLEQIALIGKIL